MSKRILSLAVLAAILMLALSGCAGAEKLTEYDFDTDKVPSVNAIIGETRKVTGVSTGIENGVRYKQYTYRSNSMFDDLLIYSGHLRDSGWMVLKDYDLNDGEGEMQLGLNSADEGKIMIISIAFYSGGYAIRVNKLDGSLTPN